jgi:hypothetical protein
MDRRTFIATALVSGASVFISAQASQQPVVLITGTRTL